MILKCSAGHSIDTSRVSVSGSMYKKPGDKCGQLLEYDRLHGSKYCQRILKKEKINLPNTQIKALKLD